MAGEKKRSWIDGDWSSRSDLSSRSSHARSSASAVHPVHPAASLLYTPEKITAQQRRAMMQIAFALLLLAAAFAAAQDSGACPDLAAMRTARVKASVEPAQLAGEWSVQALIDITQLGATCQTLNATGPFANGTLRRWRRARRAG